MRVVAWNCMGAFEKKAQFLWALTPDIAIISEITRSAAAAIEGAALCWCGDPMSKGFAIIGRNGWTLEPVYEGPCRHVLGAVARHGKDHLRVVGVWTLPVDGYYVPPVSRAWPALRAVLGLPDIVAGDFNAHPRWDTPRRIPERSFSALLQTFAADNIASIWHERNRVAHGEERIGTYFQNFDERRPYHIDYIFAANEFRSRVLGAKIGAFDDWVSSKRSDHVPLIVDATN